MVEILNLSIAARLTIHIAAMEDILVLGKKQINAGSDELDALTDAVP